MRILLLTQLFDPEPSLLLGLKFVKRLAALGHQVQVLTGFPNYPNGRIYPGYRIRLWQREFLEGVEIIRVPHYPSHDRSALRRICSYLSLALGQVFLGTFLVSRPDLVFVSIGPMTLSIPALWFGLIWRVPYLLDVQDLWPESVTGSGMLKAKWVERWIDRACQFAYRRARRLIVLSDGYKRRLVARGVDADRVTVIYNWCDPSQEKINLGEGDDPFGLAGTFNVVYAGNLGELQALDAVVRAAVLLKASSPLVRIVFLGTGTQEAALKELAEREGATNVRFIPRLPLDRLVEVLRFASVLLVHLKRDPLAEVGIPQKIQAYLATGKPILAAVTGDAADLVRRSGGGFTCVPESSDSLANSIMELVQMPQSKLREVGELGRAYYEQHLSFQVGVGKVDSVLKSVMESSVALRLSRHAEGTSA